MVQTHENYTMNIGHSIRTYLGYSKEENLKSIHKAQDSLPKLFDADDSRASKIKDCYIQLQTIKSADAQTEKKAIKLSELFNIPATQNCRVLVLGIAGVGKTTLMQYIAYQWATQNLYGIRFSYVFRVNLRNIIKEKWKEGYTPEQKRHHITACFLHYCLGNEEDRQKLSVEQIICIEQKSPTRTLLLLDGYDEVAHLTDDWSEIGGGLQRIYPNVVISSRPESISSKFKEKFDWQLENVGFEVSAKIRRYIEKYFGESDAALAQGLWQFLERNAAIKEICHTPLNISLICRLWEDQGEREKLNLDTNVGSLYHGIVNWLGKRYIEKTGTKPTFDYLSHPIFSFLRELSYQASLDGSLIIENDFLKKILEKHDRDIQDTLQKLNIHSLEAVEKMGLLRKEGAGESAPYAFIHATFQEWLTADHLKKKLLSEEVEDQREALDFIANPPNNHRYPMIMIFLSGLLTMTSGDVGKRGIYNFWKAIRLGNEYIIKVGGKKQLRLMMKLLSQTLIGGKPDPRIPQEVIDDVDYHLLQNLNRWEEELTTICYPSPKVFADLYDKLMKANEGNEKSRNEMFQALRILPYLAICGETEKRNEIINFILEKTNHEDIAIAQASLKALIPLGSDVRIQNHLINYIGYDNRDKYRDKIIHSSMEALGEMGSTLAIEPLLDNINPYRLVRRESLPYSRPIIHYFPKNDGTIISAMNALRTMRVDSFEVVSELMNLCGRFEDSELLLIDTSLKTLDELGFSKKMLIKHFFSALDEANAILGGAAVVTYNAAILSNIAGEKEEVIDAILERLGFPWILFEEGRSMISDLLRMLRKIAANIPPSRIERVLTILLKLCKTSYDGERTIINTDAWDAIIGLLHLNKVPSSFAPAIVKVLWDDHKGSDFLRFHNLNEAPEGLLNAFGRMQYRLQGIKTITNRIIEKNNIFQKPLLDLFESLKRQKHLKVNLHHSDEKYQVVVEIEAIGSRVNEIPEDMFAEILKLLLWTISDLTLVEREDPLFSLAQLFLDKPEDCTSEQNSLIESRKKEERGETENLRSIVIEEALKTIQKVAKKIDSLFIENPRLLNNLFLNLLIVIKRKESYIAEKYLSIQAISALVDSISNAHTVNVNPGIIEALRKELLSEIKETDKFFYEGYHHTSVLSSTYKSGIECSLKAFNKIAHKFSWDDYDESILILQSALSKLKVSDEKRGLFKRTIDLLQEKKFKKEHLLFEEEFQSTNEQEVEIVLDQADDKIEDIHRLIKIFDTSESALESIYNYVTKYFVDIEITYNASQGYLITLDGAKCKLDSSQADCLVYIREFIEKIAPQYLIDFEMFSDNQKKESPDLTQGEQVLEKIEKQAERFERSNDRFERSNDRLEQNINELDEIANQVKSLLLTVEFTDHMNMRELRFKGSLYQRKLYYHLRAQLNDIFVAASAVGTNIVANNQTGTFGIAGNWLSFFSNVIPSAGIGIGVQLFASVLNYVDSTLEREKIQNYRKLAVDAPSMAQFAELLAREIAEEFPQDTLNQLDEQPKKFIERCIKKFNHMWSEGQEAVDGVIQYWNGIKKNDQNPTEAAAHRHASLIANLLMSRIYSGEGVLEYSDEGSSDTNLTLLITFIHDELSHNEQSSSQIYGPQITPPQKRKVRGDLAKQIKNFFNKNGR